MANGAGGVGGLPSPPTSVAYSYLHQPSWLVDVKFFGLLAACIVVVVAVCVAVGMAQTARENRQYRREHKGLPFHDEKGDFTWRQR